MTDRLEQMALDVEARANAGLTKAHPRESIDAVIGTIVEGWNYVEATTIDGQRRIVVTTRSR